MENTRSNTRMGLVGDANTPKLNIGISSFLGLDSVNHMRMIQGIQPLKPKVHQWQQRHQNPHNKRSSRVLQQKWIEQVSLWLLQQSNYSFQPPRQWASIKQSSSLCLKKMRRLSSFCTMG